MKPRFNVVKFSIIGSIYAILIYYAINNNVVLSLRHLSLGEPDPAIILFVLVTLAFTIFWTTLTVWHDTTHRIITNVGNIVVHSLEPMTTVSPLDYREIPDMIRESLDKEIEESYEKEVYNKELNALKPMGIWADGGVSQIGVSGNRLGGESILIIPMDLFLEHESDGICIAAVEVFTGDDFFNLPPHIIRMIYENVPQFNLGKHSIIFGTEPHPISVRAYVEANNKIDKEKQQRSDYPLYVWTLGIDIQPIDAEKRSKWMKEEIIDTLTDEIADHRETLGWRKEFEDKKEEEKQKPDVTITGKVD